MKKRMSENVQRSSGSSYHPQSDNMNGENWFANHKKLLWGIGGAVVLGAGAMLILKNINDKKDEEYYNDVYDELNALNENLISEPVDEEFLITTITEID